MSTLMDEEIKRWMATHRPDSDIYFIRSKPLSNSTVIDTMGKAALFV